MTKMTLSSSSSSSFLTGALLGSTLTLVATAAATVTLLLLLQNREDEEGGKEDDDDEAYSSSRSCSQQQQQQGRQRGRRRTTVVASSSSSSLPAELRQEQLSRHTLYFGSDGMERLRHAKICIVGLGGVGSHTAHMLARGGVGYLRLIDFDQVTLSSLNRHACATLADVGIPKATCLKQFLQEICPDPTHLQIDAHVEMYTAESGERLLALPPVQQQQQQQEEQGQQPQQQGQGQQQQQKWDMVIDAIDDVPTKAALLAHCLTKGIRVISCMGAGGKSDVTRLHISDLKTAAKDPLASKLRQSLKKLLSANNNNDNDNKDDDSYDYLEDMDKLAIIYSSEKTVVKLADFTPEQKEQGVHQYGAVDGMRIRVLPVLGTMPAIMGQSLAAFALTEIGGKPFQPVPGERIGRNVRNKMYQHLKRREDKITRRILTEKGLDKIPSEDEKTGGGGCIVNGTTWIGPLQIDHDDVDYLLQVWRNRCAVSGARLGTVMELVRWDDRRPSTCDNLVLLSVHVLKQLDAAGNKEGIPVEVRRRIEARLSTCRIDSDDGDPL